MKDKVEMRTEEENQNLRVRRTRISSEFYRKLTMKDSLVETQTMRKFGKKFLAKFQAPFSVRFTQYCKNQILGGSLQGDKTDDIRNIEYEEISKFRRYQEIIVNDDNLANDLELFAESQFSVSDQYHFEEMDDSKTFELPLDMKKCFLSNYNTEKSKVLLLIGQADVGKSLFCKYLQRELLANWTHSLRNQDMDNRNWFPIYVELSSLKNPKSEAISETLTKELSLTQGEILTLQTSSQEGGSLLPLILFIFDGYDDIEDFPNLYSLNSRKDYLNKNFWVMNKIGGSL